jgi:hypothetical protein
MSAGAAQKLQSLIGEYNETAEIMTT